MAVPRPHPSHACYTQINYAPLATGLETLQAVSKALEVARKDSHEALKNRTGPNAQKLQERLLSSLVDHALDTAYEYGIPYQNHHESALVSLARFFTESPTQSVDACLLMLPKDDYLRWGLPEPWAKDHLERVRSISPNDLLLGLHALHKAPWRRYGGMIAGRVPTREYQRALRNLNRDVVVAHALHNWQVRSWSHVVWMGKAVGDLLTLSVPYEVPTHIDKMMQTVGSLYMERQFGSVVVLCRSALEVAITHVIRQRASPPFPKLQNAIDHIYRLGLLNKSAHQAAHDLRVRGNKAVHEDLQMYDTQRHAFEAMQRLTYILDALRRGVSRG